jgi:hypothetical protein
VATRHSTDRSGRCEGVLFTNHAYTEQKISATSKLPDRLGDFFGQQQQLVVIGIEGLHQLADQVFGVHAVDACRLGERLLTEIHDCPRFSKPLAEGRRLSFPACR